MHCSAVACSFVERTFLCGAVRGLMQSTLWARFLGSALSKADGLRREARWMRTPVLRMDGGDQQAWVHAGTGLGFGRG